MKKILILLAVMTSLVTGAQVPKQHFAVNMGDFSELRVVDAINVEYACNPDSAGYVVFDSDPSMASSILLSNDKYTLRIQLQTDGITLTRLPLVRVYSTYLNSAENSGDSTLTVNPPAPGPSLKLRVVGNGRIVAKNLKANLIEGKLDTGRGSMFLSGNTMWVKLRTVGTGSIEAGALKAEKCNIFMSGTGSVDCWVTGELTVTGLGSGKVYCKGRPKVKNRTLGTVKVVDMDEGPSQQK